MKLKSLILVALAGTLAPIEAQIVINEIHSDPEADLTGDENGDGTRESCDDEFIELVNSGRAAVDLAGWTFADEASVRHTFPAGTILEPNQAVVVFGGGDPANFLNFGSVLVQAASGGQLLLNNT